MDLIIARWKPGVKTISLMDLLQSRCGMGLKDAKCAVDGLLDGKEIRISGIEEATAQVLRSEIEVLGAVCEH
jgi:ribosomal protein L7/L12